MLRKPFEPETIDMKKALLIISSIFFMFSCDSNPCIDSLKKENEWLKNTLEIEKREIKTTVFEHPILKDSSELQTVFYPSMHLNKDELLSLDIQTLFLNLNDETTKASIDYAGNFSIDMGSATAGRVVGNLNEIDLIIEYLPVRPGCADNCPEMAIIHFNCKDEKKCVTDTVATELSHESGVITFTDLEFGKKIFDLLKRIQNNL